jgi:hypothetical protein
MIEEKIMTLNLVQNESDLNNSLFDEEELFEYVIKNDSISGLDVEEALSQNLIEIDELIPLGLTDPEPKPRRLTADELDDQRFTEF